MDKLELNLYDLSKIVSDKTGYTAGEIFSLYKVLDDTIGEEVAKGNNIKFGKTVRFKCKKVPKRDHLYDGIRKSYYSLPEHYVLKVVSLSNLKNAINSLNKRG